MTDTDPLTPSEQLKPSRKLLWLGIAAIILGVALVVGGIALASRHSTKQASPTTTIPKPPTTTTIAPETTTSTTTSPSTVTAQLTQVTCPTEYGIQPTSTPALPATVTESVPSAQVSQITVYTDALGQMQILAPAGWACSATIGADGSSDLAAYPQGQQSPLAQGNSADTGEQIVGGQTSSCASCRYAQTTPLFPAAASQCAVDYAGTPEACPGPYPGESVTSIGDGIVAFADPPGVKGSGAGSGGTYPANGVATYHGRQSRQGASYIETCTLPSQNHSLCTTTLNAFVQAYGSK